MLTVNDNRSGRVWPEALRRLRDFSHAPERAKGTPNERLVSFCAPSSYEAEQYRGLRHIVEESGRHVVAITSPTPGDGKTTTAINLAGALAQSSATRVLLVEADLRQPRIGDQLGLEGSDTRGLADALAADGLTLPDVVRHLPRFNLSVILAGRSPASAYEALHSSRLDELFEEARSHYTHIVVDTPPVVPVPDCRLIARLVEGFIILVGAHRTRRELLQEAFAALDPTKVLGLVFNGDDRPPRSYYGYYASHAAGGSLSNGRQ
jgi:capsular exopolysaccharide synthesis family protein